VCAWGSSRARYQVAPRSRTALCSSWQKVRDQSLAALIYRKGMQAAKLRKCGSFLQVRKHIMLAARYGGIYFCASLLWGQTCADICCCLCFGDATAQWWVTSAMVVRQSWMKLPLQLSRSRRKLLELWMLQASTTASCHQDGRAGTNSSGCAACQGVAAQSWQHA
jgi:drug/metabolite transporter superfamily protein YnfA